MKPILCLDFDGVIHSYTSGWKGADVIPDPPVPGAMEFIDKARCFFDLHIYSSRSGQAGGIQAMQRWMHGHLGLYYAKKFGLAEAVAALNVVDHEIKWPTEKPPAFVTLDDRAITFTGVWPEMDELAAFKPWNKQ